MEVVKPRRGGSGLRCRACRAEVQLDLQAPLLAQMRPFVEAHERTLHASDPARDA